MYVVLLGPPGSGKGTQGHILAEYLNINHLSTGDLFREILEDPSHPLYDKVQVVNEGKLVSDEVVNLVVENAISKDEFKNGIIFDGYPRTIAQAEALDNMLDKMDKNLSFVLDFDTKKEVLIYRISGRRVCPNCKRVFHIKQNIEKCPDCDIPLIQRDDDTEETLSKRLLEYKEKTDPLHEFYRNSGTDYVSLVIDDASKTPGEVQEEIIKKLKQNNIL